MRFIEPAVMGVSVIEPEPRGDERGSFARLWCQKEFADHGLNAAFVQCNSSFSPRARTLRGLHYQVPPHQEAKLARCVRGTVFDVVVDLRCDSPTYLRWFGLPLTPENRRMLYVPEGCAHGYLTMEENSEVVYTASAFYQPDAERGIRWNDPLFAIEWPCGGPETISAKDRNWPDFTP